MGLHAVALKQHKEQQKWHMAQVRPCSIRHTVSDSVHSVRGGTHTYIYIELTWQRPARRCPKLQGQIADGRRA